MIRFVGDVDALTGAVLVGKRPRMSSKRTGMVDSALTRRLMVNVLQLYTQLRQSALNTVRIPEQY
ncbi:hypothetical protein E6H36_01275 [Candidatus Bathyarchaeota archaeon]|nr:MAG: hypothetical protein E6H36_01275 [Candidatus Bathyarchaeota archaeon]TMI31939.1 MAG: hypothetical protein E6H29_04310 [Candidatus Bathyarchaeota archaeon]